jgi:hypothetical protein
LIIVIIIRYSIENTKHWSDLDFSSKSLHEMVEVGKADALAAIQGKKSTLNKQSNDNDKNNKNNIIIA